MKFLIAPDSFKESMSAEAACEAIARGIKTILPDAVTIALPLADGGEGTLSVLARALNGKVEQLAVTGPLFQQVKACVGTVREDTGIIEMAEAAGLHLVDVDQRNPELTTTLGVGEMIRAMMDKGIRQFLIALGGSATNDGGIGMLTALGARPLDSNGECVSPVGGSLSQVVDLDTRELDPRLSQCHFKLACDVDNPLTGSTGASAIFGPQKGATPEQVAQLDAGMDRWADVLETSFGRKVKDVPGAGAAGGLAAAFIAAFDTSLKPGIEQVLDIVGFDGHCRQVDWVITGEGSLDGQSLSGKTPVGVARRAKLLGLPVVAFAGKLGQGYEAVYQEGIDIALPITPEGMPLSQALAEAEDNIFNASQTLIQLLFNKTE